MFAEVAQQHLSVLLWFQIPRRNPVVELHDEPVELPQIRAEMAYDRVRAQHTTADPGALPLSLRPEPRELISAAGWIFCTTPDGGDAFRGNTFRRGVTWTVNPAIRIRFDEQREAELRRWNELKARIERSAADRRAVRNDSPD